MTEGSDATALNATQRDILFATGAALQGRTDPPTQAEVRHIAAEGSDRIEASTNNGVFYNAVKALVRQGYLTKAAHPTDGREKIVGLTRDGEEAIEQLAERSAEAVEGDPA